MTGCSVDEAVIICPRLPLHGVPQMFALVRNSVRQCILVVVGAVLAAGTATAAESDCSVEAAAAGSELEQPLCRLDGVEFHEYDLPPALQQTLFDVRLQYYRQRLEVVDAAVLEHYLEQRADGSGKTKQALSDELLAVKTPDDAAVEGFYKANRARIAYPLDTVREQIRQMLVREGVREKRAALVAEVKLAEPFEVAIAEPVAPFVDIDIEGFPSKGKGTAKVTIVEFADYQCPHCKDAAESLRAVYEHYPGDVRVVFMDFPINRSGISRVVAEGAACAAEQDSFWPYHDLAFARQNALAKSSPAEFAEALGLDTAAFAACMKTTLPAAQVGKGEQEAARLGLRSTPTLFLNGRRLHLHDLERELPLAIEEALAAKES